MPSTAPPTSQLSPDSGNKLARAQGRMHCDYAFYVGRHARQYWRLGGDERRLAGVCGIKAFLGSSTGSLLLNNPDDIFAALKSGPPPRRRAFRG